MSRTQGEDLAALLHCGSAAPDWKKQSCEVGLTFLSAAQLEKPVAVTMATAEGDAEQRRLLLAAFFFPLVSLADLRESHNHQATYFLSVCMSVCPSVCLSWTNYLWLSV